MTNTFPLSRQSFLMRGLLFVARHMSHWAFLRLCFRDFFLGFSEICNFSREFKTKSFRGRISIICRSSVAAIYQNKPLSLVSFFNCRNGLFSLTLFVSCTPRRSMSEIARKLRTIDGIEDTEHFLLLCPSFDIQRRDLLAGVSVALRPFVEIDSLSNNVLVQLLLYGDKNLSNDVNRSILELTLDFIHKTGRFV